MTTKARQLAELIANSLVDSDEISTGAVTTSKLADTLDFSSKTMVMADNQLSGDKIHGGTVSAFASTGIDDNASATAVTIASDGKVGIGTSSPSRLLTVSPSTGSAQIGLISQDSSLSEVLFGDVADDNVGRVYYDHASNSMSLWTNAAERMRIDSSGILLVGATSSNSANVGHGFNSNGFTYHTRDGGEVLRVNRKSSDGAIISLHKDGSVVGSIGSSIKASNRNIYIGSENTGLYFFDGYDTISPVNPATGSDRDAAIDIGRNTVRFKDLYLSGSIANPSGDLILDASGILNLNSAFSSGTAGGIIRLKDAGTQFGDLHEDSGNFLISSAQVDKDIIFKGNDGGGIITALRLDMSEGGRAYFTNGIKLSDNQKAFFGDGNDLEIYHNGGDSIIADTGTGDLYIRGSNDIRLQSATGSDTYAHFQESGYAKLYHNNSEKLATTASGIAVTGSTAHTAGDITNTISGTYNLNGANGTAGSPAYATYSFKDDPNTGMYRAAADTIAFTTAGSERLRINSSGRQSYNGTAYAIAHGNFVGEVASSGYRALSFEHTVGGGEVGSIRTTSSTAVYYGDGSQLTGVGGSTTFGAVGTYIWGRPFNGTNYAINATASSLYAITSHISAYGGQGYFRTGIGWQASPSQTAVSGTWRHMGGAGSSVLSSTDWGVPGLWVRIS